MPAHISEPSEDDVVVFLDPSTEISVLQAENERLKTENEALTTKLAEFGVALRNIAERYFSEDDNSRWFAGLECEHVDARTAYEYWRRHDGARTFGEHFPDPESVICYFRRLHSRRARITKLAPPG